MLKPIDTVKDFEIKIKVPASSGNLGSGYDTYGLALNLYNHYSCRLLRKGDDRYKEAKEKPYPVIWDVPENLFSYFTYSKENVLLQALLQIFKEADEKLPPVIISVDAGIPIARGLGSSANAIVAGLILGRELLRHLYSIKLTLDEIQFLASHLEGHPDNVTPILMGGFCFSYGKGLGDYSFTPFKIPLTMLLSIPSYSLSTSGSRELLPESISFQDAVFNLRSSSLWLKFLETGELSLLKPALEDKLHQPYRNKNIPEFALINELLLKEGHPGAVLSGSGPSVLMFLKPDEEGKVNDTVRENTKNNPEDSATVNSIAVNSIIEKVQAVYDSMQKKVQIIKVLPDNIGVRIL